MQRGTAANRTIAVRAADDVTRGSQHGVLCYMTTVGRTTWERLFTKRLLMSCPGLTLLTFSFRQPVRIWTGCCFVLDKR